VELDGQRLLLGVTPHGSRTLYVFPGAAPGIPAKVPAERAEPHLAAPRRAPRAIAILVSTVALLSLVVLVARRSASERGTASASPPFVAPAAAPSPAAPEPLPPAPQPEAPPPARPRASTGIVVGDPQHRLWVDGRLAPGSRSEVLCGPHTVRVGSSGATRVLDVPCGDSVNAALGPRHGR
jgi:hypothetical protein